QLKIEITNLKNVFPGTNLVASVTIKDQTPVSYITFDFQSFWANRNPFIQKDINGNTIPNQLNNSILRNGYLVNGTSRNQEFYQIDSYELEITNLGTETILPIIPGVNTFPIPWPANQTFNLIIPVSYNLNDSEEYKITFPNTVTPTGAN